MARWQLCNVLRSGPARQLWHFDAVKDGFKLNREQHLAPGKPLPPGLVGKSWESLWRKKLNVALLPSDKVFLRVLHLPVASEAEARQIVELQLERLSPLPAAQIVWTLHVLPKGADTTRPVIVLIADRPMVEKFLGLLELDGFLADRLELPALDQLLATAPTDDGAWIYAVEPGMPSLVAWWTGGQLRSLAWLNLPEGDGREAVLREQLLQMAWAGELEGWLKATPRFHLVADAPTAALWRPLFMNWAEAGVEVITPLPPVEVAARMARRSAATDFSLLPAEFAKRYQQQFIDRLWMRGLGALVMVYVFGVLIYFAALQVLLYKQGGVDAEAQQMALSYTNVLQTKALVQVLSDRADLKFAALDSWNAMAEQLPEGVVLQTMDFKGGKSFTISGTADSATKVTDFWENLRKVSKDGKPLFDLGRGDPPTYNSTAGNSSLSWRFALELARAEHP